MTATAQRKNATNPVTSNANTVTVLGAVARTPELETYDGNVRVLRLTVAGEELLIGADGKTRRVPFYEQAVYRDKAADAVHAMGLQAGQAVMLDGRFYMWDRDTGNPDKPEKVLDIKYAKPRPAIGFEGAERSTDAGGSSRLVGGFTRAIVRGKIVGSGGELRYIPSGSAVLNFSINAKASWRRGEEWESSVAFVRVTVWDKYAEELALFAPDKSMEAYVEGRPRRGSYEKDGKKKYTLELEASRVYFMEAEEYTGTGGGGGASYDNLPPADYGYGADEPAEDLPF